MVEVLHRKSGERREEREERREKDGEKKKSSRSEHGSFIFGSVAVWP